MSRRHYVALLLTPLERAAEAPWPAKVLSFGIGLLSSLVHHPFAFIYVLAFIASAIDYVVGYHLAERRGACDREKAATGLLIKVTALVMLLFIAAVDWWAFEHGLARLVGPGAVGAVPSGCACLWIYNEAKSINRLTQGKIPFLAPFLALLDAIFRRLIPSTEQPKRERAGGLR